jgi:hypothetical protein
MHIGLSILHWNIIEAQVVLSLCMKLLHSLTMFFSFLVSCECLVVNDLHSIVLVAIVLAEWDTHSWYLMLQYILSSPNNITYISPLGVNFLDYINAVFRLICPRTHKLSLDVSLIAQNKP